MFVELLNVYENLKRYLLEMLEIKQDKQRVNLKINRGLQRWAESGREKAEDINPLPDFIYLPGGLGNPSLTRLGLPDNPGRGPLVSDGSSGNSG